VPGIDAASSLRLRIPRWLRLTVGLAIVLGSLCFLMFRLIRDWHQIPFGRLSFAPLYLVASFVVLIFIHFPIYGWLWQAILGTLDARIPVWKAAAITALSCIGKYAPGKVWFTLGRMSFAKREGVPEAKSLLSVVLEITVTLLAGIILLGIAILLVPRSQVPARVYYLFLMIPLCLIALYPPVMNWLLRTGLKLLRLPLFEWRLSAGGLSKVLGICMLDWLAQGIGSFLLVRSFYPVALSQLPVMLGGYAVSWMIGFLILITPAGLGVREGIYTLILKTVMPEPVAIISAIVTRVWITLGELTAAVIGFALLRSSLRRSNVQRQENHTV
jgi:hypothetical protein